MNPASCQLTCRGRVCLPENIHVDAYRRSNPTLHWLIAEYIKIVNNANQELKGSYLPLGGLGVRCQYPLHCFQRQGYWTLTP